MVHAFIMVKAAAGEAEEVVEEIRGIVEVDAEEVYDVLHAASSTIQGIDGVTDSKTYIALD